MAWPHSALPSSVPIRLLNSISYPAYLNTGKYVYIFAPEPRPTGHRGGPQASRAVVLLHLHFPKSVPERVARTVMQQPDLCDIEAESYFCCSRAGVELVVKGRFRVPWAGWGLWFEWR